MRRTTIGILALAACAVVTASSSRADQIIKTDGTTLVGSVKQADGGFEITGDDKLKRFVPSREIRSIKIDATGQLDEATARERFESLRRATENERDAGRAVDRYQALLQLIDNTAAGELAKKELATWIDRRDRRLVRVGKAWLTPAERDARTADIARRAGAIRDAIAAGDSAGAAKQLREAMPLDPDGVSFLYLDGVLAYRRAQYNEAKQSFDRVADQIPDHAPTLANQAVLLARFKRWPQAAAAMDAALASAPGVQPLIDNAAELLQLIPDAQRKSPAVERFFKRFTDQEAALERRMAERKLYRWGSSWVDQATLAAAQAQRDAIEKQKRDLQLEFEQRQNTLRDIDQDVRHTQDMIRQIERDSIFRDTETGRTFQRPFPEAYWNFKRDLDTYADRRKNEEKQIAALRQQAEKIDTGGPTPPFRGELTIVGEDGVPIVEPPASTRPAVTPEMIGVPATQPSEAREPDRPTAFIPWRPTSQPSR